MEHLTTQQRAPILERFAYVYENAERFREYILSNMWAEKLERGLAKGRELLRHTYDGIFWASAMHHLRETGAEIKLEGVELALAIVHSEREARQRKNYEARAKNQKN